MKSSKKQRNLASNKSDTSAYRQDVTKLDMRTGTYYEYNACTAFRLAGEHAFERFVGDYRWFYAELAMIEIKRLDTQVIVTCPNRPDYIRNALHKLGEISADKRRHLLARAQRREVAKRVSPVTTRSGVKRQRESSSSVQEVCESEEQVDGEEKAPTRVADEDNQEDREYEFLVHFDRVDTFCRFLGSTANERSMQRERDARLPQNYRTSKFVDAVRAFLQQHFKCRSSSALVTSIVDACAGISHDDRVRYLTRFFEVQALGTVSSGCCPQCNESVLLSVYLPRRATASTDRVYSSWETHGERADTDALWAQRPSPQKSFEMPESIYSLPPKYFDIDRSLDAADRRLVGPRSALPPSKRRRVGDDGSSVSTCTLQHDEDDSDRFFADCVDKAGRHRMRSDRVLRLYWLCRHRMRSVVNVPVVDVQDGLYVLRSRRTIEQRGGMTTQEADDDEDDGDDDHEDDDDDDDETPVCTSVANEEDKTQEQSQQCSDDDADGTSKPCAPLVIGSRASYTRPFEYIADVIAAKCGF